MDTSTEIQALDDAIAEAERATQTSAALRERRAKLAAAEQAEQEARQREAETKAAAQAVRDAEADVRRAEREPLRAELHALDQPLAALERDGDAYLHQAVAVARGFHRRYVETLARRNAIAGRLDALGDRPRHVQVLDFEAFVMTRLRRFNDAGRSACGALWATQHEEV